MAAAGLLAAIAAYDHDGDGFCMGNESGRLLGSL